MRKPALRLGVLHLFGRAGTDFLTLTAGAIISGSSVLDLLPRSSESVRRCGRSR
jgi:hypothetical protein